MPALSADVFPYLTLAIQVRKWGPGELGYQGRVSGSVVLTGPTDWSVHSTGTGSEQKCDGGHLQGTPREGSGSADLSL